jgi:DNA-directed RNA polymerase subunit RPC12/RpoP
MAEGSLVRPFAGAEAQRCPTCRTKIVVPEPDGLVVKNAILRVSGKTGRAAAKCPRCKGWVEVPLNYRE